MITNPTIVVVAYNRPKPLGRLLQSLLNAHYSESEVRLVISIDKSENKEVLKLSQQFEWKFGEKKIIQHTEHLGLKEHILRCGDLSLEYESIIVLEDDLLVSPYFYQYAKQAIEFYKDENALAGISLYNYQVAESCFYPFQAIDDGSDVYFMQVASSWGQAWTKTQWQKFRNWFSLNAELPSSAAIPNYLKQWGKHSWKKHFIHYLIDTDKYFVFPRLSLTTNFEEEGTNSSTRNVFHVPLQISTSNYKFCELMLSKSVYDAWFEIKPQLLKQFNVTLINYNFEVDLYGSKEINTNDYEYILSSKEAQNPLLLFGADLFPMESNITFNLSGYAIKLYKKTKNTFIKKKLHLRNYLGALDKQEDLSFSIIIPVLQFDEQAIVKSINSIALQAYSFIEIILVTSPDNFPKIEKIITNYQIKINIIVEENSNSLDLFVGKGFEVIENKVATWITSGIEFTNDAFQHINSIFKLHPNINWLTGIDKNVTDKYAYDRLNVFKYRIVKGELYKQLKVGRLNDSTEGHFYLRNCFEKIDMQNFSLQKFFFQLIENFQLTVTVKCFFVNKIFSHPKNLSPIQKEQLIVSYKHFAYKTKLKLKLINFFLNFKIIGEESSNWYYTSLHNFPDVLRYDLENDTFYLSKH